MPHTYVAHATEPWRGFDEMPDAESAVAKTITRARAAEHASAGAEKSAVLGLRDLEMLARTHEKGRVLAAKHARRSPPLSVWSHR